MSSYVNLERLAEAAKNPYGVKVGDTVQNNDPRATQKTMTVVRVEGPYAFTDAKNVVNRIRLDRFNPNRRDNYSVVTDEA